MACCCYCCSDEGCSTCWWWYVGMVALGDYCLVMKEKDGASLVGGELGESSHSYY